jgi:hypothetical protein
MKNKYEQSKITLEETGAELLDNEHDKATYRGV